MGTKAGAARLTVKQRAERNRTIRFELAIPGANTEGVAARWGVSESYCRALRVGGIHIQDGGPVVRLQLPPISKPARRKLLETALESRRIFGTDPKFADVQQAVLGEPGVLSGRRRVRVQKLLASALRCVDRILNKNIGPSDPRTGCRLWTAGCRNRDWVRKDGKQVIMRYPFVADPADGHSLLSPERILCQLAGIPLRPRQRIPRSCKSGPLCLAVEHFVVDGVKHGL
jgi:hypothetical protein